MKDIKKAWISTYTGKKFYLLHPRLQDIDIKDIAHSLSQQCRWTGHTKFHYSIAQHAYYCSFIGPEEEAFDRLNHDNSEAYMGDMNRPLKHFTQAGPAYRAQETVVQNSIAVKYGLALVQPPSVHYADNLLLYAEKEQLIAGNHRWKIKWGTGGVSARIKIARWTPEKAEKKFLERFKELYRERLNARERR